MSTGAVIIVAAGQGVRAGEGLPKAYREIAGVPMVRRTIEAFANRPEIGRIVVVIGADHRSLYEGAVRGLEPAPIAVIGGATRSASVSHGLEALADDPPGFVLIHDAARPFVTAEVIDRVEAALLTADGAIPALPIPDAVKTVGVDGHVGPDAPRAKLRAVQTPQAFRYAPLLEAYYALPADADFTDDAAVARGAGLHVRAVKGDGDNIKLTYPDDFARAERRFAPASAAAPARVASGHGFDAHRVGPGDHVMICGVRVPADFALIGHSDADVGLHALTDAILGALGAADIGEHFPPGDPQWRGADSRIFLAHVAQLAAEAGARIEHADVTLVCERPKVKPHRQAMRASIAETLGVDVDRVSVKATTTERLGFLGRGEGLAALATATLVWARAG
jgi:2-C-methyl-D-erythritol 4-phosphate cytidylyltransferase/2-C-methyl-D-erythritol 2,4-cyclodiphosphate synthase